VGPGGGGQLKVVVAGGSRMVEAGIGDGRQGSGHT